jgi:hypothetical protein
VTQNDYEDSCSNKNVTMHLNPPRQLSNEKRKTASYTKCGEIKKGNEMKGRREM